MIQEHRKKIGKSLKDERRSRNLTQAQMSETTGIERSIISKIESGDFTGSFFKLQMYAFHLGMEFGLSKMQYEIPNFDDLEQIFKDED